jgi:hypothetical protein
MKRASLFIGKHVELTRPVNQVDENLMRRIAEAKQRLVERNIEPVALLRARPTADVERLGIAPCRARFGARVRAGAQQRGV